MIIEILEQSFDPWEWVKEYQKKKSGLQQKFGATSVFIGTMRDFNDGDDVQSMELEYYPEMTRKHLEQIANDAMNKWQLHDIAIVHRVGTIMPGDSIVCVAVWSAHRKEAYEANRMIMEDLKSKAPFWKKEQLKKGNRWVKKNTEGF